MLNLNWISILGLVAATFSTSAGIPQLVKVWKTKSSRDLSIITLGMGCCGAVLWLIYGTYIGSLPVVLANGIGLTVIVSTLYFKIRYK